MKTRPWLILLLTVCVPLVAAPVHAAFRTQAGIGFVAMLDAPEGSVFVLEDRKGEVRRGTADRFGSLIFRDLDVGATYTVRDISGDGGAAPVTTLRLEDHPDAAFYQAQSLAAGLQYLTMRDGTLLAAMVRPPAGKTLDQGPFPTVVEYSGYAAADPNSPQPLTLLAQLIDRKSTRLNSSHIQKSRMPSSA